MNDTLVKRATTPEKADAIRLRVADATTADVRAEVMLFPARKGRPGKVLETSTTYEACS